MLISLLLAVTTIATCGSYNPHNNETLLCITTTPYWHAIWRTADGHIGDDMFPTKDDCEDRLSVLKTGVNRSDYTRITKMLGVLDPPVDPCVSPYVKPVKSNPLLVTGTCGWIPVTSYIVTSASIVFGKCLLDKDLPKP